MRLEYSALAYPSQVLTIDLTTGKAVRRGRPTPNQPTAAQLDILRVLCDSFTKAPWHDHLEPSITGLTVIDDAGNRYFSSFQNNPAEPSALALFDYIRQVERDLHTYVLS